MICLLPMRTCRTGERILTCRRQLYTNCRQTGVAGPKQHESASHGLGICYSHGGRYDCHGYHGFRQSGTDRVYATDSIPSCDICLCASVGRGVPSAFNIINAADFDVATSFRSGRFFPPVCHDLPMPTLPLPIRGCMGLSLTCGHPTTPSPTPPPLAGLAWLPRARLQPPPSYPPPCPSTSHRPTTAQLRRRCSSRMSATRSQRR